MGCYDVVPTEVLSRLPKLQERLEEQRLYLQEEIRAEHNFEEIIGQSQILKRALSQVKTVAPTDQFDLTCSYNNPYDHPVTFGESSDE